MLRRPSARVLRPSEPAGPAPPSTFAETVAVSTRDLTKRYGSGHAAVEAVRGVTLEIPAGAFVVVLGPSGSGKTTLLNLIGGIDTATSGTIRAAGVALHQANSTELARYRRRSVGFVFQFFNLISSLTALENVQIIAELTGGDAVGAREHLERVGLGDRLHHFPGSLSGGEAQRVGIARALAKDPGLLLCDEPTGALDLETGRQVLDVLSRANRERRLTVVLVTHNSALAAMADRVVRMRSGEIVEIEENVRPVDASEVAW